MKLTHLFVVLYFQLWQLVVTLAITRTIPFGGNCGNAHRALLGIGVVIVLAGVAMPIYYKYLQNDLIRKDMERFDNGQLLMYHEEEAGVRRKPRSVLASNRFAATLFLMSFIMMLFVVLGWYYLWSTENRCSDPKLWAVKGWFIVFLVPTACVIFFMLVSMFKASM